MADSGAESRRLLQSVVDAARAIFGAQASSIFLLDEESGELVFEAVAGQGEEWLVGQRFPRDRGIAGWVASSGEAMVVDDLSASASFARDIAESTRYVPRSLMAVPLSYDDQVLGVLEVLDASPQARSGLAELELLGLFANQAGVALRIVSRTRAVRGALVGAGEDFSELVGLVQTLQRLDGDRRESGFRLIDSLRDVLSPTAP
ncbi:GAF domain-containing protein [Streptomyces sp. NBC_00138]|nr:GAF domain-containing protein [Streptomyces sp. NBC_00223]